MKGKRGGGGGGKAPPSDLLVCFPARAHLSLMPKAICSPSRPTDTPRRHHLPRLARGPSSRGTPLFRTRTRALPSPTPSSDVISEPTSPKVTCAGQIKQVRPRGADGRWAVAMEEMKKARGRQGRRGLHWLDALGIKKDIMHFLAAFQGLRFNVSCFGSFRHGAVDDCTSDEDEEDEQGEKGEVEEEGGNVLSKWFMLLEENHKRRGDDHDGLTKGGDGGDDDEDDESSSAAPRPPPNALLLMRCRSAPARGWLRREDKEEEVVEGKKGRGGEGKGEPGADELPPDFFKMSSEIAKETWVVGSLDPLARSRSCRR